MWTFGSAAYRRKCHRVVGPYFYFLAKKWKCNLPVRGWLWRIHAWTVNHAACLCLNAARWKDEVELLDECSLLFNYSKIISWFGVKGSPSDSAHFGLGWVLIWSDCDDWMNCNRISLFEDACEDARDSFKMLLQSWRFLRILSDSFKDAEGIFEILDDFLKDA